ncbi:MAG: kelch repeat-containing protein [Planctomycetota bacterium]
MRIGATALGVVLLCTAGCHGCTGDDDNDPPPPAPEAPTNLAATPLGSERIDLAWTDNATNESEFRIQRSADGGASWTEIARLPADSASYADLGLVQGSAYSYRVQAVNSGGASPWAGPASAATRVRAWTSLPTGPSPRLDHSAIYDPVGQRMIVFGGFTGSGGTADLWELTLPSSGLPVWTQLTASGTPPSARWGHSAIYDPVGHQMIVFGGEDGGPSLPTTVHALRLDILSWTTLSLSGSPPGRYDHSAVYIPDPSTPRMILFGGYNRNDALGDLWELTLPASGSPAWTQLSPSGSPPGPHYSHVLVYDSLNGRLLAFGGNDGSAIGNPYDNRVWELRLNPLQWTLLSPAGSPSPRYGAAGIFDATHGRLTLFGGDDGNIPLDNALWILGPSSWSTPAVSGILPVGRVGHSAVYDELNRRMVIFGGFDENLIPLNDAWALDL